MSKLKVRIQEVFFILLADQFPVGDEKENAKLDGNLKLSVGWTLNEVEQKFFHCSIVFVRTAKAARETNDETKLFQRSKRRSHDELNSFANFRARTFVATLPPVPAAVWQKRKHKRLRCLVEHNNFATLRFLFQFYEIICRSQRRGLDMSQLKGLEIRIP